MTSRPPVDPDRTIARTTPASEQLGKIGEREFQSLCSRALLTCNKSLEDETGWDFRVEAPFAPEDARALDRRSPRLCQVQVKATTGGSRTVSLKLSAVERLAKDPAPAAIIVLRLTRHGAPIAGYVIHLIDATLGKVLHRLRKAEAEGRCDLNRIKISFDYVGGRRFELTPEGLRAALDEVWGEVPDAYSRRKLLQRETLGVPADGGLEAEALVWIEGKDHYIRVLSGLEPVTPRNLKAYERRFDIRLPYTGDMLDGIAEIRLQPPYAGPCTIAVRKGPLDPAAIFRCDAFVPPPMEDGPLRVIRHPLIAVLFNADGLAFETVGDFGRCSRSLDDWALVLRALSYLASGGATVSLEFGEARLPPVPVAPGAMDGPYLDELPFLLTLVDRWLTCVERAGVIASQPVTLDQIWAARGLQLAMDILMNPSPAARLEFDEIQDAEEQASVEALYFDSVAFAGAEIAYAVKVRLERDGTNGAGFSSSEFELLDIRPGGIDLKAYGAGQAGEHGLGVLIDPDNVTRVDTAAVEHRVSDVSASPPDPA